MFTKVIKEISIAASSSAAVTQDTNPRLRTAILKAKGANMPKDNIDRAIKKGTGELEGVSYEEILYEAYGPGRRGDADRDPPPTTRTARPRRSATSSTRAAATSGTAGSVKHHLFHRKGLIAFDASSPRRTSSWSLRWRRAPRT